ncbi:Leucine-rich repeat-containing protein 40 [Podochytrium sp. JEL0797]|nr:Leucine-rich repeat-containing protein 40 [Podochytrium sp. JEL0797]
MLRNRPGQNGNPSSFKQPSNAAPATSQSVIKLISQARGSGRLNLSNQGLAAIPSELFTRADAVGGNWWEEVDLTRIVVADNEMEAIDARICELGALTLIDAHNNKLSSLPDLSSLSNLSVLNLASNFLSMIPESLFSLPLAELHLSHNKISVLSISPTAAASQTLTVLDISNNTLTSLPFMGPAPRLTKLLLQSNHLAGPLQLPSTPRAAFPMLNHLDVSHNRLTELQTLPFHAPNLILLNASQNQLSRLFVPHAGAGERVICLPGLIQLDLRVNRLATLSCPVPVSTPLLKELLLQSNQLSTVSGSGVVESGVKSIETLDVRDNNLDAVPNEVVEMVALTRLFVEGNQIRVPRRAIVEKGTGAIVKWMKERLAV